MSGAGDLRELVAFDCRQLVDDGYGNSEAGFLEVFQTYASFSALKGGEAVQADRLSGNQPYLVTVRYLPNVQAVTTDWRIRDVRTGRAFALRTFVPRPRRDYADMICVAGVADADPTSGGLFSLDLSLDQNSPETLLVF